METAVLSIVLTAPIATSGYPKKFNPKSNHQLAEIITTPIATLGYLKESNPKSKEVITNSLKLLCFGCVGGTGSFIAAAVVVASNDDAKTEHSKTNGTQGCKLHDQHKHSDSLLNKKSQSPYQLHNIICHFSPLSLHAGMQSSLMRLLTELNMISDHILYNNCDSDLS
ncbi:hypothetical protein FF38_04763 [Lucilia cuprina]|uniref:Uncharacterized protein n=1 Tax=Lucilia cuprina TaxID=7375 RepID=A0A0L0CTB1_LUCCU|nr:hypothetical protein FF38_04763 [Lucilia cuprina]